MDRSTKRRQFLSLLSGTAAAAALPGRARAQGVPTGNVRLLVPYPAGGGSDVMSSRPGPGAI